MRTLKITCNHGWTVEALRTYERTLQTVKLRHRVMAVRLVMEGQKGIDVARFLGLHRDSVSTYVKNFTIGGMEALLKQTPPPGKRPYLTEEEQQELKRMIVESTPAEEGFGLESCWNTRILQYVIEDKFAVTMSRSGITDLLHRLNLRYTRPTYTLAKANKEKQEAFVQQMDWIKKTSPITTY